MKKLSIILTLLALIIAISSVGCAQPKPELPQQEMLPSNIDKLDEKYREDWENKKIFDNQYMYRPYLADAELLKPGMSMIEAVNVLGKPHNYYQPANEFDRDSIGWYTKDGCAITIYFNLPEGLPTESVYKKENALNYGMITEIYKTKLTDEQVMGWVMLDTYQTEKPKFLDIQKISVGMSFEEAIRALGRPHENVTPPPVSGSTALKWITEENSQIVLIFFSPDGKVLSEAENISEYFYSLYIYSIRTFS